MRVRRHNRRWSTLASAFVVSLILHLPVALSLQPALQWLMSASHQKKPQVTVQALSSSAWDRSIAAAKRTAQKSRSVKIVQAKDKKKRTPLKPKGQIVQVARSKDRRPPKEARFSASENNRVKEEMVARLDARDPNVKNVTARLQRVDPKAAAASGGQNGRRGQVNGQNRLTRSRPSQTPSTAKKKQKSSKTKERRRKSSQGGKKKKIAKDGRKTKEDQSLFKLTPPSLQRPSNSSLRLTPPSLDSFSIRGTPSGSGRTNGSAGVGKAGPKNNASNVSWKDLQPTLGTLAHIAGSPSDDYIENVQEGDATQLNTFGYKYATFFYGVRERVGPRWRTALREAERIHGIHTLRGRRGILQTVVLVRLDSAGTIEDVSLKHSSGVRWMDALSMQAFEESVAFPNPPTGLLDESGKVEFPFGFVYQIR